MAVKKTTDTAEKKTTKTTAAKTTKAAKTTEEKAPAKRACGRKPAAKAVETKVYIEYNGAKVAIDEVVENVKATYKANGGTEEIKSLDVYVKPNESAAYFVVNGEIEGNKMDVYFC